MAEERETKTVQKEPEIKGPLSEQWLAPAAIGLGILLIVGGIILGVTQNQKAVVKLPEYTPVYLSPQPTITTSPSPAPSPTSKSESETVITQAPPAAVKGITTTGSQDAKGQPSKSVATPSPLPLLTPQEVLPLYTQVEVLPNYTPQFVAPEKETIAVELIVQGKTYALEVNKGATVAEAMEKARAQGLLFKTTDYGPLGLLVTEINGQANGVGGMNWTYGVSNVRCANRGVSLWTLQNNDRITWTYSTFENSPCK